MTNAHEIIITTQEDPKPRVVDFSELYTLREDISSMMYLWDTNCYYVDVVNRTFIINGGRKIKFETFRDSRILYRRRNQVHVTMDAPGSNGKKHDIHWLLGIEDKGTGDMVFVEVTENGHDFAWQNKL